MTTRSPASPVLTQRDLRESTELFEVKQGMLASIASLKQLLPDVETALFFAKVYQLDYVKLSSLLVKLFPKLDVVQALLGEGSSHSSDLQDYIVSTVPDDIIAVYGEGHYDDDNPPPDTDLLVAAFESITVEVADSIAKVAEKIGHVLSTMSSKYGSMTFQHMLKLNRQRNSIGTYEPLIKHEQVPDRLVIFDVSGSVSEYTVRRLVDEVVGFAYAINATLAIVSNNTYVWEPGTFTSKDVLAQAEYGGTHYETLVPLLRRDWDTVVTIADYDSSSSAKSAINTKATGHVREVIDISLVNRTTFLAECVGQLASKIRPILIGASSYPLHR